LRPADFGDFNLALTPSVHRNPTPTKNLLTIPTPVTPQPCFTGTCVHCVYLKCWSLTLTSDTSLLSYMHLAIKVVELVWFSLIQSLFWLMIITRTVDQ